MAADGNSSSAPQAVYSSGWLNICYAHLLWLGEPPMDSLSGAATCLRSHGPLFLSILFGQRPFYKIFPPQKISYFRFQIYEKLESFPRSYDQCGTFSWRLLICIDGYEIRPLRDVSTFQVTNWFFNRIEFHIGN